MDNPAHPLRADQPLHRQYRSPCLQPAFLPGNVPPLYRAGTTEHRTPPSASRLTDSLPDAAGNIKHSFPDELLDGLAHHAQLSPFREQSVTFKTSSGAIIQ